MRIDEQFVYGFLFAVIAVSIVLATQYGDHFNFLKGKGLTILPSYGEALNWKSAIAFSLVFSLFFKNLVGTVSYRLINAFMVLAFSWAIFDFLWIVKAVYMGNFLFGSETLTFPTQRELLIGVTRNATIVLLSIPFAFKFFKLSCLAALSIVIFFAYWFFLLMPFLFGKPRVIMFSILFYAPSFYFFNFLPFLTAFKERTEKTWKTFLFA